MADTFGLVVATPQEAGPIKACLGLGRQVRRGRRPVWGNGSIFLVTSGMGKEVARSSALNLVDDFGVNWLISAGVSGALRDGFSAGQIVDVRTVVGDGDCLWPASPLPVPAAPTSSGRGNGVRLFCSEQVLAHPADKRAAGVRADADIVDMESAGVAEAARERGIRFSCVRGISDTVDDALPLDFSRYIDSSGQLQLGALIGFVLLHPRVIRPLLALGKTTHNTSKVLGTILAAGLSQPRALSC